MTTALSARVARFPFPFATDSYRYSTNVEPARRPVTTAAGGWGAGVLDVDDDYVAELAVRRAVLAADPTRCQELPHMRVASWDALTTLLPELASTCPGTTVLDRDGDRWTWRNELLGTARTFTVGDDQIVVPLTLTEEVDAPDFWWRVTNPPWSRAR